MTVGEVRASAQQLLTGRLIAFAGQVSQRSALTVGGVLIFISLLKCGFVVWNWFELSPQLLTNWGAPNTAFQANVLFNAFGTAWMSAGLDTTSMVWLITQVAVTICALILIATLVLKRTKADSSYLALAAVLSSGIAAVAWREIGRYDAFYLVGIAVALLALRTWVSWLGAAIAALTSPEQTLIAGGLLLLIALTPNFREWVQGATRLLVTAISAILLVQIWFTIAGHADRTRIGILVPFISGQPIGAVTAYDPKQGFLSFTLEKAMVAFSAGPSLVWSYLGATALLLLVALLAQRSWRMAAYLLVVVTILPICLATVFGEDRTRDLALICAPMILAIAVYGSRTIGELAVRLPGGAQVWLIWAAVIVTLIPLTYFYLYAEEPFHWAKELLIALNNGVPLEQDGSPR